MSRSRAERSPACAAVRSMVSSPGVVSLIPSDAFSGDSVEGWLEDFRRNHWRREAPPSSRYPLDSCMRMTDFGAPELDVEVTMSSQSTHWFGGRHVGLNSVDRERRR